MARNYQAEYSRRQANFAKRIGVPEYSVRNSPLLRTMSRGREPKYYSQLSAAEKTNVFDFIHDHPRTPVGRDNIKRAAKGEGRLSDLRRPWRNPENIRPMIEYVMSTKRALEAAVDGLFNSQAEIDLRNLDARGRRKEGGPEELFIGWGSFLRSWDPQPAGSKRRRPLPLKPDLAARKALALAYSVPAPYVMMQLVKSGKEDLLQLYTD